MPPRRRCPTCGSKQWHKEPSSGLIACSEGHILQNYRNETTEIQDMGPHAMKKRTLKSGRVKKGKESDANPKLYHGARGRYHYFLCLQLIFRKQIAALTQLWELPLEFEVVCRDLWALHLTLLPDPPPAEPYQHAAEDDSDESVNEGSMRGDANREDQGNEEDGDSEMEALMRENSEISSSEEEENGAPVSVLRKKPRARGRAAYESPVSTIAVLVVACWTMRIPVLYRDFSRAIESYEVPYLDPMRFLPPSMMQHLTKHNIQALSPPHAPSTMSMHGLASRFARKLYRQYGIRTPEANGACLLWRLTKDMGGTPTTYMLAKRVAGVLSLPLTLHHSLGPGLEKKKSWDALRHQYDNGPPEVQLVASLMIVLKMVYGLDGKERVPKDADEALARKTEVLAQISRLDDADAKEREATFDSRYMLRVGDMSSEEVDRYISFCGEVLVGQVDGEGVLDRYFPLVEGGMDKREYSGREVTSSSEYRTVVCRSAVVAGVAVEYVGGVIEKCERRLLKWMTAST